ncbi:hypothetical protein TrLO_g1860 [Triparma laevis f. longispina]|uniref:Uncharacterized protein n=1 Tax=Triparma laevis f. longispina TaxID=1714387 RepID=A0A9W7ADA5_9STRA|nr:hypothetical protein TrLO_g1860 [Triparma laevis f. longispina]
MTTFTPPDNYVWVLFSIGPVAFIATQMAGGPVMKADSFNRVQRGAQFWLESMSPLQMTAVVAGLTYPLTTTLGFNTYLVGNFMYAAGYADTSLDVKSARYKKGGVLKPVGMLICLGASSASVGKIGGLF